MRVGSPRENYLGLRGWVWAGRYDIERYLYSLHRITGLGLVLYLFMHLTVMAIVRGILGEGSYDDVIDFFEHPVFKVGEYAVFAAFVYHGLNGLRLIFQELGFLLGKPKPPIYPFRDSLRRRRPLTLGMMGFVVVLAAFVLTDFAKGGP